MTTENNDRAALAEEALSEIDLIEGGHQNFRGWSGTEGACKRLRAAIDRLAAAPSQATVPDDRAALAKIKAHTNPYESNYVDQGWIYKTATEALAVAPQAPAAPEALLTEPATVGSGTFQAGVKERLVIKAAQRQYEWTQSPEGKAARAEEMKRAAPFLAELQAVAAPEAPKGEPTMADAIAAGDGTLHGAIDYWQARALAAEAPKAEPVAWRCKDFADGWVLFNTQHEAAKYQECTGCLMQPLYTTPQPKRVQAEGNEAFDAKVIELREWLRDHHAIYLAPHTVRRLLFVAHGITGEAG